MSPIRIESGITPVTESGLLNLEMRRLWNLERELIDKAQGVQDRLGTGIKLDSAMRGEMSFIEIGFHKKDDGGSMSVYAPIVEAQLAGNDGRTHRMGKMAILPDGSVMRYRQGDKPFLGGVEVQTRLNNKVVFNLFSENIGKGYMNTGDHRVSEKGTYFMGFAERFGKNKDIVGVRKAMYKIETDLASQLFEPAIG